MYTGLQGGMKLSLAANVVLNWVCPVLSFPECFQPSTAPAMYIVAINVFAPRAFNPESQYFIPLFNKISWLCGQQPGGDEASNEGCNSGQTQAQQCMTLPITLICVTQTMQNSHFEHSQWGYLMLSHPPKTNDLCAAHFLANNAQSMHTIVPFNQRVWQIWPYFYVK
jgi:hypothetical protein